MIVLSIQKKLLAAQGEMTLSVETTIKQGEIVTLYGESGAGKTSILRMLAGLLTPDSGCIGVKGETWFHHKKKIDKPIQQRSVGFLFQDYALFPNMTVRQNIAYAQHQKDEKAVLEMVALMELNGIVNQKPTLLSGGQKQRVALARALIQQPEILLLDEPLSALDEKTRLALQNHLLSLQKQFNLTIILVSHDISEIIRLSNRVLWLERGEIVKEGTPQELFTGSNFSGKFQFVGHVVEVQQQDFMLILTILIGNELVRIVTNQEEGPFTLGDKVQVASKAFNPIIKRL